MSRKATVRPRAPADDPDSRAQESLGQGDLALTERLLRAADRIVRRARGRHGGLSCRALLLQRGAQRVVRLTLFRIERERPLERRDRVGALPL